MKRRLLFISHDASRTGAPIVLLQLIEWLKRENNLEIDVFLGSGGELEKNFLNASKHMFVFPKKRIKNPRLIELIVKKIINRLKVNNPLKQLGKKLAKNKYDLIYANSIASSDVLKWLMIYVNSPLILHVHELENAIQYYCNPESFQQIKSKVNIFLSVSDIVSQNLKINHGIPDSKINLVPGFIPFVNQKVRKKRIEILSELNLPENSFIIGGSGTIDWRKGCDLFVQVARFFFQKIGKECPCYFIWIGGKEKQNEIHFMRYDVDQLGLSGKVFFPGSFSNPFNHFNAFDLFLMTSREDPFPLVCLETAQLGKPIICFDKGVGSTEFIDEQVGSVVPYMDTHAMALAAIDFFENPEKRQKAGDIIKNRVAKYHVEVIGPKIVDLIELVSSQSAYLS